MVQGAQTVLVKDEEFVRAWASAAKRGLTLADLAQELGLDYKFVWNKGRQLSVIGVSMPHLWGMRRSNQEKAKGLNQIIQQVMKGKTL